MFETSPKKSLVGTGSPDSDLSPAELRVIVEQALTDIEPGATVLVIIPDKTRDDNTDLLFPFTVDILGLKRLAKFDVLVAQGTHPAMTDAEKLEKVGAVNGDLFHGVGRIFDHQWREPEELVTIGTLPAERVFELTGGLLDKEISLSINRLLAPGTYDTVLIFGGTVPHEVAGFAGGAKYFFPGISGPELTHATHWLGALVSIEKTIGRVETPTRHLIEAAADLLDQQIICFTTVVTRTAENRLRTHALFAGDFRESLRHGAEVSREVHIKFTGRKYKRVVALLDEHYDDLWVGGKASYKLGGIIEDAGELVIYAPHLNAVSATHGSLIEKYGYLPMAAMRDIAAENADLRENLCVAAHLTHVSYGGREDANGNIVPLYQITLATGLSRETCDRLKLGYLDHQAFSISEYQDDAGTLVVEKAGKDLYLVG